MPLIHLVPGGKTLEAPAGTSLETLLFAYGVEFPCGGESACGGCRVRVLDGTIALTPEMRQVFTDEQLAQGWRLACRGQVEGPLTLEIAGWEVEILGDEALVEIEPAEGLGIAIDLGTTTLVAQLLDLATGATLASAAALNPQSAWGTDIMSRIHMALDPEGLAELRDSIRGGLAGLVRQCCAEAGRDGVRRVLICGNTVMHHLFAGFEVEALSHVPFETPRLGALEFTPAELGWPLPAGATIGFLPCLGGFVGSDLLAGILARGLDRAPAGALIDLGTNGEIVLAANRRILCASTAAGPAFEAGRIRSGMRAMTGAIAHAEARDGRIVCRVVGGAEPRGICGSGLVEAVAAGLELGLVLPAGRLANSARELPLDGGVSLSQADIRELQLAKAAIASGLRLLCGQAGVALEDVPSVDLAGAFGNYVGVAAARRIGLLEVAAGRVHPAGNTALRGTKAMLLAPAGTAPRARRILRRAEHVALAVDPRFQDVFVGCLMFPEG